MIDTVKIGDIELPTPIVFLHENPHCYAPACTPLNVFIWDLEEPYPQKNFPQKDLSKGRFGFKWFENGEEKHTYLWLCELEDQEFMPAERFQEIEAFV